MTNKQTEERWIYDVHAKLIYPKRENLDFGEGPENTFEGYFFNQIFPKEIKGGDFIDIFGFEWGVRGRGGVLHCAETESYSAHSILKVVTSAREETSYRHYRDFLKRYQYSSTKFIEAHKNEHK